MSRGPPGGSYEMAPLPNQQPPDRTEKATRSRARQYCAASYQVQSEPRFDHLRRAGFSVVEIRVEGIMICYSTKVGRYLQ